METNMSAALLIGTIVSSLSWTLFIFVAIRIFDLLKTSAPLKLAKSGQTPVRRPSKALRERVDTHPHILCSLPIYQESGPQGPAYIKDKV